MKTRVIPAQVTTVEDKIAGNLNFTQILLLVASVLISTGIFVILPRPMSLELYKILLIIGTFVTFGTLAIRIRERVVLSWIVLLVTYAARPRIYTFDKNSTFARFIEKSRADKSKSAQISKSTQVANKTFAKDGLDYVSASRNTDYNIRFNSKGVKVLKTL